MIMYLDIWSSRMLLLMVMVAAFLQEVTGSSILMTRRFTKFSLPHADELLNVNATYFSFTALGCSMACNDWPVCKSFTLSTTGECVLYTEFFGPGSNSNTDMEYYRNECVKKDAYKFNGRLTTSQSGLPCLNWIQAPKTYPDSNFIDGSAEKAQNFCREPSHLDARPWCFVNDTTWEYCDIEFCCLEYDAQLYEGTVSHTETGLECQRWDTQYPHEHEGYYTAPETQNYCRATYDTEGMTWCYTTDPSVRFGYCAVRECGY